VPTVAGISNDSNKTHTAKQPTSSLSPLQTDSQTTRHHLTPQLILLVITYSEQIWITDLNLSSCHCPTGYPSPYFSFTVAPSSLSSPCASSSLPSPITEFTTPSKFSILAFNHSNQDKPPPPVVAPYPQPIKEVPFPQHHHVLCPHSNTPASFLCKQITSSRTLPVPFPLPLRHYHNKHRLIHSLLRTSRASTIVQQSLTCNNTSTTSVTSQWYREINNNNSTANTSTYLRTSFSVGNLFFSSWIITGLHYNLLSKLLSCFLLSTTLVRLCVICFVLVNLWILILRIGLFILT